MDNKNNDSVKKTGMNKKYVKYIKLGLTLAIILGVVWFVVIYPKIIFGKNEDKFIDAAKRYFEINASKLPKEGNLSTVSLQTLYHQKYVSDIKTVYTNDACNIEDSWVKVKREEGEYKYFVYLECGSFKSKADHEGPVIKLNGDEVIELKKGEKFTDPGIKSVRDKTDGNIDVKNVVVKGSVDTSKAGTYKITYTVLDSFKNKTVLTRKVVVSLDLKTVIETDTNKGNVYKGLVENNYVSFAGRLFRLVKLNSDGTVKIVSNEDVGTVNYDDIDKYLNDYYYSSIYEKSKDLLVKNYKWCNDQVGDKELNSRKKCNNNTNRNIVGLLSLADYNNSVDTGSSYLYSDTINWMSDYSSKNEAWATREGFIGTDSRYYSFDKDYNFSVRPAFVLKKNIKVVDGTGSKDDPYIIDDFKKGKVGSKINTRYSGEYVSYGDTLYRIVEKEDGYTKVVSNDVLYFNYKEIETFYDTKSKSKIYNPKEKGNVGYFIENETSKYIKSDIFVKRKIEVPIYSKTATYSGKKSTKEYSVKFSAPGIYDLYSTVNCDNYWLRDSSKKQYIKYVVSQNATIYYNELADSTKAGIRVSAYLDKDVTILSGKGTEDDPYVLAK